MSFYSLILLAAGRGLRMKNSTPKQFMNLAGKPLLMHVLERIDKINEINEILIVTNEEFYDPITLMLKNRNFTKPYKFVLGGLTRQESVLNGLKEATSDHIILHEAARPFVLESDFRQLIDSQSENVTFAIDIPFTVLEGDVIIEDILDRSKLLNIQLPQKFNRKALLESHIVAIKEKKIFTEDASLLFSYTKEKISVIHGYEKNIKITTPFDFILGEQLYKSFIINEEGLS